MRRRRINAFVKTASREEKRFKNSFDLCLGHFLYPYGLAAAQIAKQLNVPAVASLGESRMDRYELVFDRDQIRRLLRQFSGVITHSNRIRDFCVRNYGLSPGRIQVIRNGVDTEKFSVRDKESERRLVGLPLDRFILSFVGGFFEWKGPLRVLQAIEAHPDIGAVFLGSGPRGPPVHKYCTRVQWRTTRCPYGWAPQISLSCQPRTKAVAMPFLRPSLVACRQCLPTDLSIMKSSLKRWPFSWSRVIRSLYGRR